MKEASTTYEEAAPLVRSRIADYVELTKPRIGVIFGKPLKIMVERPEPGGCKDARLAHRAAEHAPCANRPGNVPAASGDHAADRATQPFRQRDRNEIEG